MVDLRLSSKRRQFRVPSGVLAFLVGLAILPISYGALILLDYMAFYNNSVPARAVVVNMEPTRVPMPPRVAEGVSAGDYGPNEMFFVPRFFYTHENGETYVGGAMTDSSRWRMKPGQQVDIRYHRGKPDLAQPVTIMSFWSTPALFIGCGIVLLFLVLVGFLYTKIEDAWAQPVQIRRTARLNLFRR